jgi:hypothetical protein
MRTAWSLVPVPVSPSSCQIARIDHHGTLTEPWARAWLRVMWACWHNDTIYDPARHGAERRLAART